MNVTNHNYNMGDKFEYNGLIYTIVDICGDFIGGERDKEIYSFYYDKATKKIQKSYW